MKWIVTTYEVDYEVIADSCEIMDRMLLFTKDSNIVSVFAEWCSCEECEDTKGNLVVLKNTPATVKS